MAQKALDREQKEHMLEKHDKRRSDLQGFIDRFGAKSSKARQAQSKARIVEKLEDEMDSIDLAPSSRIYPNLAFEPLRPSGATVLTVKDIAKAYGPKKVLEKVSFEIERGERVAIIGPNGIGKSTLLEILMQNQTADQGGFNWGFAARYAYFPQDHAREVNAGMSLLDWLSQFDREMTQEGSESCWGAFFFQETPSISRSQLERGRNSPPPSGEDHAAETQCPDIR